MERYCLIGLGNPGPRYRGTRHNIGADWIEAVMMSPPFERQSPKYTEKFESLWWSGQYLEMEIHFLFPQTFMNLSGRAVKLWASKYQGPAHYLVVMDDMDLDLGKLRLRRAGSDGGHRGLRSIIEVMGTQEIPRLKIGVGRPLTDAKEHVLESFRPEEKVICRQIMERAPKDFSIWVESGIEAAMNAINGSILGGESK